MIQDSDRELTIEERENILSNKIEAIKEPSTWAGDLELSRISTVKVVLEPPSK